VLDIVAAFALSPIPRSHPTAFVPDYWPLLQAYHEVRDPLYRRIIAQVDVAPNGLILDAGCGDCFYGRLMVDVLGPEVRIVGVDRNPAVLPGQPAPHPAIWVCQSDLERIGVRSSVFDAVWLCRALHSAMDPVQWLAALARLLRPGGKVIVIENDLAHSPILSWPAEFERRIQDAHVRYMKRRSPDERTLARYYAGRYLPAWFEQIGLRDIAVRTYVSEEVAPMSAEVEGYWRLVLDWLAKRIWPFLSHEDREIYTCLSDPQSADYVLRRPGFCCMELTTVACGIAP
jgi:SAM-dependent methyltransferase